MSEKKPIFVSVRIIRFNSKVLKSLEPFSDFSRTEDAHL